MAKKVSVHFDEFQSHVKAQEKYAKKVAAIYSGAVQDAAAIGANLNAPVGKAFSFKDYPQAKKAIDQLVNGMANDITTTISEGVTEEWLHAAKVNDSIVKQVFHNSKLTKDQISKYMNRNLDALYAFQIRKVNGLNLSDRVWKYTNQFKEEMEMAFDLGLGDGKSAAALSRDMKQYLQNPNKLFHRVRDKHGKLQLSKNAKAYHPGRGVYRSSHKNAMRLTRTETNMAYRTSDYVRIQQLDFVIGIRVKLSNNHTLNGVPFTDICDELAGEYPKDFKFPGWHTQCRCHTETILAEEEEFLEQQKALLNGEDVSGWQFKGGVNELPPQFTQWLGKNADKIKNAKSKPYFLKENFGNGGIHDAAKAWQKAGGSKYNKTLKDTKYQLIEQGAIDYEKQYAQKKIEQALAAGYSGPELDDLKVALGTPGVTSSQLSVKSNKLLHAVKKTTDKAKTIPPPPLTEAQKTTIGNKVADHKPKDPLRSQLEKEFTKPEVDGLLDAYYKHTGKKASKSHSDYLSYLDYEISWIQKETLSKYKTSPALLKLLKEERDKIQAIIAKEAKEAAKKAKKAIYPDAPAASGTIPTTFEAHKAWVCKKAQKDLDHISNEIEFGPKPKPKTLEKHYTKEELMKVREAELKHQQAILDMDGDDWSYLVIEKEGELNELKRKLSFKYHHKKTKLTKRDKLTDQEYLGLLKKEKGKIDQIFSELTERDLEDYAKNFGVLKDEVKSIHHYTGSYAYDINYRLRHQQATSSDYFFKTVISRGLEKMPRFEGALRRGISDSKGFIIKQIKDAVNSKGKWIDEGFFSTAYRGKGFSGDIKFRIETKSGGIVDQISQYKREAEVLLRAGSRFKVESIFHREGRWYVYLVDE